MSHYNFKLAEQAQHHFKEMADTFGADIDYSIEHSFTDTLLENQGFSQDDIEPHPVIEVVDMTTEQAVHTYAEDYMYHTAVLNFASYKYPGGGFIKGSKAQEEMLCHASTLYNVISSDKFARDYKEHQSQKNPLYKNWLIYSPHIIFPYRNSDEVDEFVNVVTCAAPNLSAYNKPLGDTQYKNILYRRIEHILHTMKMQGDKLAILGAFGCGVFKNDPYKVAEIFKYLLSTYNFGFEKVVFAIPAGPNLDAFKKVFNK